MRLVCTVFFFGFFGFITCTFAHIQCDSNRTVIRDLKESERMLSRSRRYLSFPKSSSFVVTLTGLKSIQLREPTNWNLDLEFDMIWPIPSETVKKKFNRPMKKYTRLHRHKRDLYSNIELSLNRLGLPGRECMLRTICEARGFLHPPGVSFVDDLLRVILSHGEHSTGELDLYDFAYKSGRECDIHYKCPISLLQFLLDNDFVDQ